jgi:hypothetical protein
MRDHLVKMMGALFPGSGVSAMTVEPGPYPSLNIFHYFLVLQFNLVKI